MKVAVIIAGYNAEKTIARAIRSALAQNEVAEVMVVDDASTDRTLEVAKSCDDGTGRLMVLAQPFNQGPAAARNRGIKASTSPFISILDSDDVILDGRYADMLESDDWDMIADDIAFVSEAMSLDETLPFVRRGQNTRTPLDLAQFVLRSIPRPGYYGRELGFLKPLVRKAFLQENNLFFAEDMRLCEDYEFYCRIQIAGARVTLLQRCGYLAFERVGSLSSLHSVKDLERVLDANARLLAGYSLSPEQRDAILQHQSHHRAKTDYRKVLEIKKSHGYAAAIVWLASKPQAVAAVLNMWVADKASGFTWGEPAKQDSGILRYLLSEV